MKKILLILSLLLISNVYAAEVNCSWLPWCRWNINTQNEEKTIDYLISPEYSWVEQFYKNNLSDNDIKEIKKIYDKLEERKIYCLTHWWYSWNWCWNWLRDLLNETYNNLRLYINYDNQEKYNEYIKNNSEIKDLWNFKYTITLEKKYIERTNILNEKQKNIVNNNIKRLNNKQITLLENQLNKMLEKTNDKKQKLIIREIINITEEIKNDILINELFKENTENKLQPNFSDL